jgi:hypothetical protein
MTSDHELVNSGLGQTKNANQIMDMSVYQMAREKHTNKPGRENRFFDRQCQSFTNFQKTTPVGADNGVQNRTNLNLQTEVLPLIRRF